MSNPFQTPQPRASLSEVHETVEVPMKGSSWRRWLAITGRVFVEIL